MAGAPRQIWDDPSGLSSSAGTVLPVPDRGPYSVDFDELLAEASATVRGRPDLVEGMEALQDPPDLEQVIAGQRDVLAAGVDSSLTRCLSVAARLHEILVVQLSAARRLQLEQLDVEDEQVELLKTALPKAQEQREFRTLLTEWEVQRRDVVASLESAMLSMALAALNNALAEDAAPRMTVKSFEGLRQSVTTERIVVTDVYEQLERMIQGRSEGSFGVAGPRGAGKSTLVRFFAGTPGVRKAADHRTAERERLGVVVSAPVSYDPREFVLHLYAELCSRVLGDQRPPRRPEDSPPPATILRIPRHRAKTALAAFGAAALTGGAGLLALAVQRRLPWTWHPLVDAGAAVILVAAALLGVFLQSGSPVRVVEDRTGTAMTPVGRPRFAAICSATAVAGLVLMFAGADEGGARTVFLAGAALLALGYPAARIAWFVHRVDQRSQSPAWARAVAEHAEQNRLSELAFGHLRQIRFQQSISLERSLALKASGGGAGVDAGTKRGETWQERPKTYPELVADLRAFLVAVAEEYVVVVGVDELDKLRSHEDVEAFLNDIKAVFGTFGCFFLVSVSEDAAAGFERRGVPFRDVFDSAFDDVVSVQHLDLRSARKVLHGLLLGWTEPFVGLCYVLSGGLPRDLRRIARELITHRDSADVIELGTAALAISRREIEARIRAIRHELMQDPFDPVTIDLLTRIADLAPATAAPSDLLSWHDQLSGWAAKTIGPGNRICAAARLASELAALSLLSATIVEFFDPEGAPDRIREAEKPDVGPKSLATLAVARRTLAQSSGISLACTRRFRAAWNLASGA